MNRGLRICLWSSVVQVAMVSVVCIWLTLHKRAAAQMVTTDGLSLVIGTVLESGRHEAGMTILGDQKDAKVGEVDILADSLDHKKWRYITTIRTSAVATKGLDCWDQVSRKILASLEGEGESIRYIGSIEYKWWGDKANLYLDREHTVPMGTYLVRRGTLDKVAEAGVGIREKHASGA